MHRKTESIWLFLTSLRATKKKLPPLFHGKGKEAEAGLVFRKKVTLILLRGGEEYQGGRDGRIF